jgi:tetratricopeptide (TPR) repeat protein
MPNRLPDVRPLPSSTGVRSGFWGVTVSAVLVAASAVLPVVAAAQNQAIDTAYLAAESGAWSTSAHAWRRVLDRNPNLAVAAAYTLQSAPPEARVAIASAMLAPPISLGGRRAMAQLDLAWGNAREAWVALQPLPANDSTGQAWLEFADAARTAGAAAVSRDAYSAALAVHPSADVAAHGAAAALASGDANSALTMLQRAQQMPGASDSATIASTLLPLRIRVLAHLGRMAEAESAIVHDGHLLGEQARVSIEREVAWGYVRSGDIPHAKATASEFGLAGDSDVVGWLALYAGDLKTARTNLHHPTGLTADAMTALLLLSRTTADTAPSVGQAFVLLARGDTAAAAEHFVSASTSVRDAAPLLLATAARLHTAQRHDALAVPIWRTVIEQYASAPEAPEADLEWGRALLRGADTAGAVARWEHLILTYPESALVPLARHELEAAKATA